MSRPTQVSLNLQALRDNVAVARDLAGAARVMAVVKADAYGHGAVTIAAALSPLVDALAVACLEEALVLRAAGVEAPILLLEGVFAEDELAQVAAHSLWLTVANLEQLAWLEQATLSTPVPCWLKVDTGMNRLGIRVADAVNCYGRLERCSNAADRPVLYTHFACADNPGNTASAEQLELFNAVPCNAPRSAANSAALLCLPASRYDWVRPGYMLYGNSPLADPDDNVQSLQPVMTFTSRVIALREVAAGRSVGYGATFVARRPTLIATIAAGYGDGYPRQAPNGTPVLVNGQRATLAGRVSMDMLTVDVTGLEGIEIGSAVTLWGDGLPVDEVARYAGTVGYELLTRLPSRPPRVVTAP